MKDLAKIREYWTSYTIPRWPAFDEAKNLLKNDLNELTSWLKGQASVSPGVTVWNHKKIKTVSYTHLTLPTILLV